MNSTFRPKSKKMRLIMDILEIMHKFLLNSTSHYVTSHLTE